MLPLDPLGLLILLKLPMLPSELSLRRSTGPSPATPLDTPSSWAGWVLLAIVVGCEIDRFGVIFGGGGRSGLEAGTELQENRKSLVKLFKILPFLGCVH